MKDTIGEAAAATGVSPRMIRHYESLGLLPPAARSEGGYRLYDPPTLHTLRFIRQARELGFALPQIAALLALWQDRARPSREVKALARAQIEALDRKARGLLAMKASLAALVERCHGDGRPDCPILDGLAAGPPTGTAACGACTAADADADAADVLGAGAPGDAVVDAPTVAHAARAADPAPGRPGAVAAAPAPATVRSRAHPAEPAAPGPAPSARLARRRPATRA